MNRSLLRYLFSDFASLGIWVLTLTLMEDVTYLTVHHCYGINNRKSHGLPLKCMIFSVLSLLSRSFFCLSHPLLRDPLPPHCSHLLCSLLLPQFLTSSVAELPLKLRTQLKHPLIKATELKAIFGRMHFRSFKNRKHGSNKGLKHGKP